MVALAGLPSRSTKAKAHQSAAFIKAYPSGAKFLSSHTVGADACHRPAWAGVCLRGDASIAPYIHFTGGTVGKGLDPSWALTPYTPVQL